MTSAIGAVFLSVETGRVMLVLRSHKTSYPNHFSFVGGKIESNETHTEALLREITEEMGYVPEYSDMIPFSVFKSPDGNFEYYSILVTVEEEFIPKLNNESDGYCWVDIKYLPKPLHPGAKATLYNDYIVGDIISIWKSKKYGELFVNTVIDQF